MNKLLFFSFSFFPFPLPVGVLFPITPGLGIEYGLTQKKSTKVPLPGK